ncbi:hypothetical protein [Syntrophotalea acetylenica]|jgi:hypothetical protein|uniref:hypothetical protein n=1 Tax=Syntrophotalea acetylenica TaxID=29542 RepID=UPI001313EBEC|nr:hypothetical protein [Syntrophotalea acetylenica]MDY0261054.1 hypothetical protein [Syntrophotalea acetylenica]
MATAGLSFGFFVPAAFVVDLLEKGNLLADGKFFTSWPAFSQAGGTAQVRAPLAEVAVGTRMFFVLHGTISCAFGQRENGFI